MRTIDVTGGEAEYLTGVVTEKNGKDLASTTFEVGLGTDDTPPASWQAPDAQSVTGSTARVSLLVDDIAQIGSQRVLWVKVGDTPEVLHVPCRNERVTVV